MDLVLPYRPSCGDLVLDASIETVHPRLAHGWTTEPGEGLVEGAGTPSVDRRFSSARAFVLDGRTGKASASG